MGQLASPGTIPPLGESVASPDQRRWSNRPEEYLEARRGRITQPGCASLPVLGFEVDLSFAFDTSFEQVLERRLSREAARKLIGRHVEIGV
jgi:hypothetical protein